MTDIARPDPATAAALAATEHRRQQALIDGDLAVLDGLFDDSLVHVHAPGVTMNKAQLLEHTATRRAYLSITRGELDQRIIGDVAVVVGPITNRLRTADGGERTLHGIATQVLHHDQDGRWRYLSFQMTPLTEQAWPALPSQQPVQADPGDRP